MAPCKCRLRGVGVRSVAADDGVLHSLLHVARGRAHRCLCRLQRVRVAECHGRPDIHRSRGVRSAVNRLSAGLQRFQPLGQQTPDASEPMPHQGPMVHAKGPRRGTVRDTRGGNHDQRHLRGGAGHPVTESGDFVVSGRTSVPASGAIGCETGAARPGRRTDPPQPARHGQCGVGGRHHRRGRDRWRATGNRDQRTDSRRAAQFRLDGDPLVLRVLK